MLQSLACADNTLSLESPVVMGILNVTPDSFSDGGKFDSRDNALRHALEMASAGAAIVDVGGESTRPGARAVGAQEELDRVCPVIEAIRSECRAIVSIDTSKPEVISGAVAAGAGIVNDVRALQTPGALEAAVSAAVPVCLMHMQGEPATMQDNPSYKDVVIDVMAFLKSRMQACVAAGIPEDRLVIDPGFGFGKNLSHNLQLLQSLDKFGELNVPLLAGISRKSMIGQLLEVPMEARLAGSLSSAVIAAIKGAKILRVHDVGPTVEALKIVAAVQSAAQPGVNTL